MRRKRSIRKKLFVIVASLLLFFVLVKVIISIGTILPTAAQVVFHRAASLRESNGKINILILGIGGGTHDGPDLTDTIIFASLDPKANTINLISIPRDFWVPELQGKINSAYASGQVNGKNKGLLLAENTVEKVTGQQIDYGFRIDFSGFVKAIDAVGGVDVTVANTLDDYVYPIEGKEDDTCDHAPLEIQTFTATDSAEVDNQQFFSCRYKHLHFDLGLQHMDGTTALEFVRSRHAVGSEGSDFARSARQQLVIEAFRNKMFSVQTFLNPGSIFNVLGIIKDSIDTDIQQSEITLFIQLAQKMQHAKINSSVLDYGDAATDRPGLLINPPISSAYSFASVLIPRTGEGSYTEIQQYIICVLAKGNCPVSKEPQVVTASTH